MSEKDPHRVITMGMLDEMEEKRQKELEVMESKLRDAAQTAVDIQNACNLSGVVQTFSKILSEVLWPFAKVHGYGTDWVNRHPISVLFSSKIAALTSSEICDDFSKAYDQCLILAKKD